MLSISESLEVLVSILRIERMWKNLTLEVMKEYFEILLYKQGLSGIQQKNHKGNGKCECCY